MKQLIEFKNGARHIGNSLALIMPQPHSEVKIIHDIDAATPEELDALIKDPHNDELLKKIKNKVKLKQ